MSDSRKVNAEALVELLRTEGIDFQNGSKSWVLDCPLCGKRKFAIRKTDGYSKCYKCGEDFKGWADFTLAKLLKSSRAELARLIYGVSYSTFTTKKVEDLDRFVDHWGEQSPVDEEEIVLSGPQWPLEIFVSPDHHPLESRVGAPGLAYLENRGVSLELAQEYGVKYDPVQERVIFPIVIEGVLRGWQGRLIRRVQYVDKSGHERELPKVMTEGEVGGKILGFQDRLKGLDYGIITEGPFDAIKMHLCGGNTFTMGKSVTPVQLDIYVRHYGLRKIYIGLDDDAADEVMRVVRALTAYGDITMYRIEAAPGREDLGAGTLDENLEQFRAARRVVPGQLITYFKDHKFG